MVKKKKVAEVKPVAEPTRLYIEYNTSSEGGHALSDERWSDRSDEHTTVDFIRLHRNPPSHRFFYDSIELSHPEMAALDKLYLAVVRYTTGDTFGTSYGRWHIVGIAPKYEIAAAMLEEALKPADKGDYKNYKPWEGYFERFEDTEIHTLEVV